MNKSKLHSQVARLPAYRALTARARSVWQSLWSFAGGAEADEAGELQLSCRVRVETLADAEGCSRRTVLVSLAELERAGFLARSRTGRATEFSLFPAPRDVQNPAHQMRSPLHIRCAESCTSDAQNPAHRAAPSICIHQDHLTKTTTTGAVDGGGSIPSGKRPPEPAALHGAAAVAFEILTDRSCPPGARFSTPADQSALRRLLVPLADASWPVVELARYALDRARTPGLKNPRGMVIATLKEPDLHAVYEHAARQRELEDHRARAGARGAARASTAAHEARQAEERRRHAEAVFEAASPEQLADAVERVRAGASAYLRRQIRDLTTEQLLAKPSARALIVEALGHHPRVAQTR